MMAAFHFMSTGFLLLSGIVIDIAVNSLPTLVPVTSARTRSIQTEAATTTPTLPKASLDPSKNSIINTKSPTPKLKTPSVTADKSTTHRYKQEYDRSMMKIYTYGIPGAAAAVFFLCMCFFYLGCCYNRKERYLVRQSNRRNVEEIALCETNKRNVETATANTNHNRSRNNSLNCEPPTRNSSFNHHTKKHNDVKFKWPGFTGGGGGRSSRPTSSRPVSNASSTLYYADGAGSNAFLKATNL